MFDVGKIKMVAAVLVAAGVTGCASLDSTVKSYAQNSHKLAKDGSGVVYGAVLHAASEDETAEQYCAAINNADPRCADAVQYNAASVCPAFGYAAAGAGGAVLVAKSIPIHYCRGGSSDCMYVKARFEEGKLGTVLEVVSEKEDKNICYWSGFPRAGGTVCPAYNWDYRKDMRDWNSTNGIMTVKD